MRIATIGWMGAALLVAACGKGAPEAAAGDDNAGMMISNEAVMSDDMGASNMAGVDAATGNVAR